ncbi:unnamed protein product [Meloidogyne enterolobii]|uniref:Uncharacterized protein n=1 Tax=Meloidogyne enterolobii TaxID=390850 RepID=A0ACB0YN29_MELEN
MIKLLFDETTKLPLQIHSQKSNLFMYKDYFHSCLLNFVLNNLTSNQFTIYLDDAVDIGEYQDVLFTILLNGGNKFSKICYRNRKLTELYNLIIQHIETSKNFSKMVREILLVDVYGRLMLSDRAENIDINVENFTLKSTKYQLSNKYNPEIKFSVYIEEIYVINNQPISDIEIKRIN